MSKTKFNKNKLFLTSIIMFLMFSFLIGFLLFSAVQNSRKIIYVPKTMTNITKGEKIVKDMITMVPQSRSNIDENLITNEEDILGKYALRDYGVNENFFASSITDNYLRSIQEKARYGGIAIPVNSLQTANGEIKENDFVKIIIVSPNQNAEEQVIVSDSGEVLPAPSTKLLFTPELSAVRVLGLYSSDGRSIQSSKELQLTGESEKGILQPAMAILDALPKQQVMLLQAQNGGSIHMVIIPKEIQDKYRKLWGLLDKDDIDLSIKGQEEYQEGLEKLEKDHYDVSNDVIKEADDKENEINNGAYDSEETSNNDIEEAEVIPEEEAEVLVSE